MKPIDDALRLVLQHAQGKSPAPMPVADALGRTLAEDVVSDIDSPPFDKSLVDGFAVIAADAVAGAELAVSGEIAAGQVPIAPVIAGAAMRIMTGAPIPAGADAVVMLEDTEPVETRSDNTERIRVASPTTRVAQHIMRRGASLVCQQTVLRRGGPIRPIEIGLLCEVGRSTVRVVPPARVAVLPTGDELVAADVYPEPGQIRNSNGPVLAASVRQLGAEPIVLDVARDDREHLRELVKQGLQHDVLLLSGGVSAGKWDLVPSVLEQLRVQQVFHKVRLKPGKPLWFGVLRRVGPPTLVFGLPGNPVSSLVCFQLFVRPALMRIMGVENTHCVARQAMVTNPFQQSGDRPTYYPSVLSEDSDGLKVRPLPWKGSADLGTLSDANCLAFFPQGDRLYRPGDWVQVVDL